MIYAERAKNHSLHARFLSFTLHHIGRVLSRRLAYLPPNGGEGEQEHEEG